MITCGEHLRNKCCLVPTSSCIYIVVCIYLCLFSECHLFLVVLVVLVFSHLYFTLFICVREYEKKNKGII